MTPTFTYNYSSGIGMLDENAREKEPFEFDYHSGGYDHAIIEYRQHLSNLRHYQVSDPTQWVDKIGKTVGEGEFEMKDSDYIVGEKHYGIKLAHRVATQKCSTHCDWPDCTLPECVDKPRVPAEQKTTQKNKTMNEEQPCINPIENQRKSALKHYEEASRAISHWSSFVEAAIKAYNPVSAEQPNEGNKIMCFADKTDSNSTFVRIVDGKNQYKAEVFDDVVCFHIYRSEEKVLTTSIDLPTTLPGSGNVEEAKDKELLDFYKGLANIHICSKGNLITNYGTLLCSMCGGSRGINLLIEQKDIERFAASFQPPPAEGKGGWTDDQLIDFHNFIFRHENQSLKMGEYLSQFKASTTPVQAGEEAVEFAEFIDKGGWWVEDGLWSNKTPWQELTTSQLYEIFKNIIL